MAHTLEKSSFWNIRALSIFHACFKLFLIHEFSQFFFSNISHDIKHIYNVSLCISALYNKSGQPPSSVYTHKFSRNIIRITKSLCQCIKVKKLSEFFSPFHGGKCCWKSFHNIINFSLLTKDFLHKVMAFQKLICPLFNIGLYDCYIQRSNCGNNLWPLCRLIKSLFQQYRTFQIFPHASKMPANIRQQCDGNLIMSQIRIIYPNESIHLMIGIDRHCDQWTYFLCF